MRRTATPHSPPRCSAPTAMGSSGRRRCSMAAAREPQGARGTALTSARRQAPSEPTRAPRVIPFTAVRSCRVISELAMPRITETATIGLDPDTLWNEIGAFGSVGDWHPLLDSVELLGQGTGAMRIAHAKEGAEQA